MLDFKFGWYDLNVNLNLGLYLRFGIGGFKKMELKTVLERGFV